MNLSVSAKIKRAMKEPKRIGSFSKRLFNKVTRKPYHILYKQIDKVQRKSLLSDASGNWKIVRSLQPNLSKMPFSSLSHILSRMNSDFLDWEEKGKELTKKSTVDVSVVILVLNNIDMTLRCIESVLHSKNKANVEVIVVDNGSNSKTIKGLRKFLEDYTDVKLVHVDQNVNFALGNNIGFFEATGKISIFLNNDTYVTTDGWIDQLVKPLKDASIKVAQPTLLYPDDTIQCIGITFSNKSDIGYGMYVGKRRTDKVVKDRRVRAVTGACLAVSSNDFLKVKGFDPVFINGQEDVDLCLRIGGLERQKQGFIASSSVVYHDEGKTPGRGKFVIYNRRTFLDRWQGKIIADDEAMYRQDGYDIDRWRVDFKDFKDMGIEVYLPVLKKRISK